MDKGRRIIGVAVLVVVIAVVAGWLMLGDTTTPAVADAVQDRFVEQAGTSPGDPGVYRYFTVGFEEVDALSGGRHQYPAETFMTITDGDCGPVVRWDALAERWIEWEHCGPDLAVSSSSSYHEWFGIPDLEAEVCLEPRPIDGAGGDTTMTVCENDGMFETYQTTIIGRQVLEVGGVAVDTIHIRRISTLSGGSTGTAEVDVWRLDDTALIVRMEVSRISVTPSAVGDVTYVEEFVLRLAGLTPSG